MVGDKYWSTGITVRFAPPAPESTEERCHVSLKFFDGGFCNNDSTEGVLRGRYYETNLTHALDLLIQDAARMGIEMRGVFDLAPALYAEGDGESDDEYYPADWQGVLQAQAARLGWRTYDYIPDEVESCEQPA